LTVFKPFLVVLALLLSSCATQIPKPSETSVSQARQQQHLAHISQIQSYELSGRLGVVTQKQGFSGSIAWQHDPSHDAIDVFSPIGGKIAQITQNASGVSLTDQKGHQITANDVESLTELTLGFKLPLKGLSDWALGRPTNSKINAVEWDEQGRITLLKQDGWDIQYEHYMQVDTVFLPQKVVLKSEKVNLKLLVEQWKKVE
jgi:outer membrane lipoprotein LolB